MHWLDNDGSLRWIAEPGGSISTLMPWRRQRRRSAAYRRDPQRQPARPEQPGKVEGVIELRQTNGDEVWQRKYRRR
ncbi:MAG: hypothetical protein IPK53_07465 [bacterium]|nr:hypothetical protein [bacterium]